MEPFNNIISSKDELYEIYRNPSETVTTKESSIIDQGCEDFIKQSTFLLVGTSNLNGELDVSPRGGPAGFVKVIDNHRLVIPDLNGNNRLDSIQNIVEQGNIGLLFIIPGLGETLRINGQAYITKEEQILELFSDELRTPKTAIGVVVETAFIHCAKSFRRGNMWEPREWPDKKDVPSPGQMLVDHSGLEGSITGAEVDQLLEAGYKVDLAEDLPE
tara:strand:- start:158 stop:805 length:648 start_codon:yes stop_codon:yes gene_type:complete